MTQPVVFISYSHKDEKEKNRLLSHLDVLQRQKLVGLWSDDQIRAGAYWRQEIEKSMKQASVAILLISANFLTSDFILGQEVPTLLKRSESEGLIIFPVIAKACAWKAVSWLAQLDVRPKNGSPIWGAGGRRVDQELAAIAEEVIELVNTHPRTTPPPGGSAAKSSGEASGANEPPPEPTRPPVEQSGGPAIQSPAGLTGFGPDQAALMRQLYADAQKVLIEKPLSGGYGGAQILLVQPINAQGRPAAHQIVKLGERPELKREHDNSVKFVEADLPLVAARVSKYVERGGLAAIAYTFVGGSVLGQTRTLEAYYQSAPVSEIKQTLTALLENALGKSWYRHTQPHPCFFAEEYGGQLVEQLRLKLRPASADGLWPANQPPLATEGYEQLAVDSIGSDFQNIPPGSLVQVTGLVVSKVKTHEFKLQHPAEPGVVVKVERHSQQDFAPGEAVMVRGEVVYNRQQRLAQIVRDAFAGFAEAGVEVGQDRLPWDGGYPNPLLLYPQILNQVLRGKKSMVHGDLHLRNVLVDQTGRPWLIDFARVIERHNLYDFIKLETYIRQMILSQAQYRFSFDGYLQFEEALAAASLGRPTAAPTQPDLQKAYEVIRAIRELASHYMDYPADFQGEYFPALFLYNLAVLKYYENHGPKAARLAFAAAAVMGRALTGAEVAATPPPATAEAPTAPPPAEVKQAASKAQSQPTLSPEDEQFQREMLAQHQRNLRLLLKQKNTYGAGTEPLHLLNQIDYEEEEIKKIRRELGE